MNESSQAITAVKREVKISEWQRQIQERQNQRQERLKPILDDLFAWLNEFPVSGGTKLAKAVQYCLNEKPYLYRCLEDGNIPVDNNRAENAIRPFVVGERTGCLSILSRVPRQVPLSTLSPPQPRRTD